ncbi:e1-E2 ATPase domain-containing protein [Phthorimaea operculella]|nr:e1-E2 ATPase domain-containing protein [Phthorimaea operculella]
MKKIFKANKKSKTPDSHQNAPARKSDGNIVTSTASALGLPLHVKHHDTSAEHLDTLKQEFNTAAHFLAPKQLEVFYKTDVENGLTDSRAADLLEKDGPNQLKTQVNTGYCKIFVHNLFGWFQCVLWAGALVNYIAYGVLGKKEGGGHSSNEYLYLAIVITATVIGTGLFGFYIEAKNLSTMSGFEKMTPPNSYVIREGIKKEIPNINVVVGDIVMMIGGQTVPADCRLLECSNFKTDMSSLTGESLPISHTPLCTNSNPLESRNMVYFSCPITEGSAKGLVIATGENTEIGKIAGLVTGLKKEQTPLNKEITRFIKLICAVAFFFGIIFFVMVFLVQRDWLNAFIYFLGIILANVPEGLLVTLTVCMTLSAKELKKRHCLAKSLQAVETLGSTSCICSDKTGTLTQNRMTVSHLFCNLTIIQKNDHTVVADPVFTQLCLAACLNLTATFTHDTMDEPIERRKVFGDASEAAILRYMEDNRSATSLQKLYPKVAEIPFSSVYKYQVTIHQVNDENYLIMKGAPEIVLEYCTSFMITESTTPDTEHTEQILVGESREITPQVKKELKTNFIKIANMGERMIGYADIHLPRDQFPIGFKFSTQEKNFPVEKLRFVGAISMIDPARPEVPGAIAKCRDAGIKVTMVTGDHPVTALAISRKIGTITNQTAFDYAFEHHIEVADVPTHIKNQFISAVITGDDLRKMSTHDLRQIIQRYDELTFARTSPQQKLFIVENYQALHYVVAVTGDGVNDSPALKKANIGIAMGITGTEVSKRAADMILLDDNFASIVLGVEEGRRIFDNLKKTIAYTLTSNTPEMMPFVLYACLGIPLPMTLMLILVVNVGTDLLPAISLAYETSESDIMHIPPRKLSDHLVTKQLLYMAYFQIGLIQFFGALYAYLTVMSEAGFFPGTLVFIRDAWESKNKACRDSFGRLWYYNDRKKLEKKAQTAYFVAVCLTQVSDVIICKTRRISLCKKGMRNWVLNISILVDVTAALLVTYLPFCQTVFGTMPLDWYNFFLSVPFMVLMIGVDEIRRYLVRNNISKWLEEETAY